MQDPIAQSLPALVPADILTRSADGIQTHLRAADGAEAGKRDSELKKASQEFEGIFIGYILKVMRETIDESEKDGGFGKTIYTELFDQEISRTMAQHGTLGIADLIYKRLSNQAPVPEDDAVSNPEAGGQVNVPSVTSDSPDDGQSSEVPDFRLPVQGPISSGFGMRRDPFSHSLRFHKGVDFAAPAGTEVRAAKGGEVVFAGYDHGYGNTVVIQHPEGVQTRYAHLGAIDVKAGDMVAEEQLLGVVGSTGRSTGPHLHFEVTRNGGQIDPRSTMGE